MPFNRPKSTFPLLPPAGAIILYYIFRFRATNFSFYIFFTLDYLFSISIMNNTYKLNKYSFIVLYIVGIMYYKLCCMLYNLLNIKITQISN